MRELYNIKIIAVDPQLAVIWDTTISTFLWHYFHNREHAVLNLLQGKISKRYAYIFLLS